MKISLSVSLAADDARPIHYDLSLPYPFGKISGMGSIRWACKPSEREYTDLGVEFKTLDEVHARTLRTILDEIEHENHSRFNLEEVLPSGWNCEVQSC